MGTQNIAINQEADQTSGGCCGGGQCACSAEKAEKVEKVEAKGGCCGGE